MAGAFQCMFIRGAIFTLTKKHGSNKAARNDELKTIFRHLEFQHDNRLNIQCTRLVDVMSRRWNGVKSRDEFVARFSADKATRLDVASHSHFFLHLLLNKFRYLLRSMRLSTIFFPWCCHRGMLAKLVSTAVQALLTYITVIHYVNTMGFIPTGI